MFESDLTPELLKDIILPPLLNNYALTNIS
jgi:hypothetical protein